jgi:tRNA threonylcarbamoyladenosine biosynthesis protein TsaE
MEWQYTLVDLPTIARRILSTYGAKRVYALEGELGAGKTTLVAELCRQLGVRVPTSSPTFSIVNSYPSPRGEVLHLDAYRLDTTEEALAAGLEEQIATAPYAVFIEWPAVLEPLLPDDVVFMRLSHDSTDSVQRRRLTITTGHPAS